MSAIKIGKIKIGKADSSKSNIKTAAEITAECEQELTDQAKQIHKQESKLAERMSFDTERVYYFSVVFKSNDERNKFLKDHHIKLHDDDFVFADDISDKWA